MGRSLRHRKAAHSTNTWPVVYTINTTVQLQQAEPPTKWRQGFG